MKERLNIIFINFDSYLSIIFHSREWITEAKNIASAYHTIIFGTRPADGSYKNCGVSIPISYCIDNTGEAILEAAAEKRQDIKMNF